MDILWKDTPSYGSCLTCGTSSCTRGFIDLISDVDVRRENTEIVGNVDIVLCADCLTQAAGAIGCIDPEKAEAMAWNISELTDSMEKAHDEAASWQQRYENLVEVMSVLELVKHDSGDNPLGSGVDFIPSVDTRVQESGELPSKSNGKAAPGSRGKRKRTSR